jgi:hypothetical protein
LSNQICDLSFTFPPPGFASYDMMSSPVIARGKYARARREGNALAEPCSCSICRYAATRLPHPPEKFSVAITIRNKGDFIHTDIESALPA